MPTRLVSKHNPLSPKPASTNTLPTEPESLPPRVVAVVKTTRHSLVWHLRWS
jgi:hypothetical protein